MNSPSYDELISVTDAAQLLGVGRNDMHRIPVERQPLGATEGYKKSSIIDWALQDLALSESLLTALREKHRAARRPKPIRHPRNCPRCDGELKREKVSHAALGDTRLNRLLEHLRCANDDLAIQCNKLQACLNKLEARLSSDTLVGDQWTKTETLTIDVGEYLEKLRSLMSQPWILRCSKCPTVFGPSGIDDEADDAEYIDDGQRFDNEQDELHAVIDEMATMTTSTYRVNEGAGRLEPAGDIHRPNDDGDKEG